MAAQRGSQSKPTRFRGPAVITLRGAGSSGNDPLKVGDGTDIGLDIQVPAVQTVNGDVVGQSVNAFQISQPAGSVVFALTPNLDIAQSGVMASVQFVRQFVLTAAQLQAMYAAPAQLIAALAAGAGIVIDQVLFEMKATATAFTGGGPVSLQYGTTVHGGGVSTHSGSVPSSVVNAASAGNTLTMLGPNTAANGTTIPNDGTNANSGIYISNTGAPFAAGTGTAIVTVYGSFVTLG